MVEEIMRSCSKYFNASSAKGKPRESGLTSFMFADNTEEKFDLFCYISQFYAETSL